MSRRGLLLLLAAALAFSVMSVIVKIAGERLPSQMMVLARALVTVVISWVWVKRAGLDPRGNDRPRLVLRSLLGFSALACFFFAVTRLPLAEVTVIHYLNPILVALFAAVFLKERAGAALALAIALALGGVVLVARPGFLFGASNLDGAGVVAALVGAFMSAGAYTTVRRLRKTDDPLVVVLWFAAIAVPLSAVLVAPVFVWPRGVEWLLLLGVGVTTQLGQVFLTRGLAIVPAGPATTIGYSQIVFATTWGFAVFDERPTPLTFVGMALVFLGIVVLVLPRRGRRDATAT